VSVDVFTIFNEIIDNDFKLNTDPLIIEEKKNKGNDKSKGRYVTLKKTGKIFAFSFDKDEEKLILTIPQKILTRKTMLLFCVKTKARFMCCLLN
jgi:hypothetical protein